MANPIRWPPKAARAFIRRRSINLQTFSIHLASHPRRRRSPPGCFVRKGNTTLSIPQPPSADQIAAARLAHWHQNSPEDAETQTVALLTVESARRFIATSGLVLFSPRPQHIASPAPSLVEATLGHSNTSPTLAESAEARILLARMIAEGSAVPLNLLGAPSTTPDAPDFIASAATFPYIFTLRGDKAWKQPPATSGASKVSPLALNTYTLLLENGPTSAYDLVTQLGKEVTEAAVLRSLNELWQNLRVLPVPQADGGATLWETVANRFTKQLKAGANAGQPSALSALISLYLSQALLATETEIETFLSPLAPRSRVRDVLHALTGARQLETVAVDGKTHLHVHGELPSFTTSGQATDSDATEEGQQTDPDAAPIELAEDGSRITKFVPKPRKVGTGYIERAKPFGSTPRPTRESRPFDRKGPPRDRESRPFIRPAESRPASKSVGAGARPARPAFSKPWDEEKKQRIERESAQASPTLSGSEGEQFQTIDLDAGPAAPSARASFPKRPFASKARFGGDRPAFTRKPSSDGGDRPAYSRNRDSGAPARPPRRGFTPREGADARPPRREFSGPGNPPAGDRKPFARSKFGDSKREGFAARPSRDRPASGGGERRPFRREDSGADGRPPRREFSPRPEGVTRPPRRDFAPRGDSDRGSYSKPRVFRERQDGESQASPERPERPAFRKFDAPRGPRKPFPPRESGDSRPQRRDFAGPGKPSFGPRKPFVRSGTGEGASPREGGFPKREGGFSGKREGAGYAGKKPFGSKPGGFAGKKPFSAKPPGRRSVDAPGASTFDKFKGGNKPWGKRPPGRKPKPHPGEA